MMDTKRSGTLALLSDIPIIPDVSNLCKFNFVSSISECKGDRINFLFRFNEYMIDLADFDDYPDGIILLMDSDSITITNKHQYGIWYSNGESTNISEPSIMYPGKINIVTKNNGIVHNYML